jgi:hypothetical protein
VYSRIIDNKTYTFGVSGMLYRSNVLMYDHQSESLWSQVMRQAVTGPMTGQRLQVIPSSLTTWKKWRDRYPDTTALSQATGHVRDYSRDPYEEYYASSSGLFGFLKGGPGAEEKELVVGVSIDGTTRAYRLEELRSAGQIEDQLAGEKISIRFNQDTDIITVKGQEDRTIDHMIVYWFVWKSLYPQADVYR